MAMRRTHDAYVQTEGQGHTLMSLTLMGVLLTFSQSNSCMIPVL